MAKVYSVRAYQSLLDSASISVQSRIKTLELTDRLTGLSDRLFDEWYQLSSLVPLIQQEKAENQEPHKQVYSYLSGRIQAVHDQLQNDYPQ